MYHAQFHVPMSCDSCCNACNSVLMSDVRNLACRCAAPFVVIKWCIALTNLINSYTASALLTMLLSIILLHSQPCAPSSQSYGASSFKLLSVRNMQQTESNIECSTHTCVGVKSPREIFSQLIEEFFNESKSHWSPSHWSIAPREATILAAYTLARQYAHESEWPTHIKILVKCEMAH